jgi:hypothetical protein
MDLLATSNPLPTRDEKQCVAPAGTAFCKYRIKIFDRLRAG